MKIINLNSKIKNIFFFIVCFLLLMVFSCFVFDLNGDTIWNFGFSYNIAKGLIPYVDFNMVIGPLYNLFISIFLKLFGNYLIVFNIINSLMFSFILLVVFKKIGCKALIIPLCLGILPYIFGYNTFCLLLFILILILLDSNSKYKYLYIGIIMGMIMMTKHNIGILLMIINLFLVPDKKGKLVSILGYIIPIIFVTIYLILNNALYGYINFCYLGLGSFMDNLKIDIYTFVLLLLVDFWLVRKYLFNKDKKILYLLTFQIIIFPIFDFYHIFVALLPVIYYYFLSYENKKFLLFWVEVLSISFIIINFTLALKLSFPTFFFKNNFLRYINISTNIDYVNDFCNYVSQKEKENKVYLFYGGAYLIRMSLNEDNSIYDLINNGNLGKNEDYYLEKMISNCQNRKCLFILENNHLDSQIDKEFTNYVRKNYYYLETLPYGNDVYVNYK
ncbi:hypothetical protein EGW03_03955 [bacterium]|nr:hypothetical protein [bacterium]